MTTQADGSSRMDETAATEMPDAMTDANAARGAKEKKGARGKSQAARVTQELPAIDLEPAQEPAQQPPAAPESTAQPMAELDDGATREVPAVTPSGPLAAQPMLASDDPDATIVRPQPYAPPAPPAPLAPIDQPMTEPVAPRRYNTLASTFNRSRTAASDPAAPVNRGAEPARAASPTPPTPPAPMPAPMAAPVTSAFSSGPRYPTANDDAEEFVDEVDDSEDEWAVADQPTVQWTPQQIQQMQQLKPDFLQTGEQPSWPPRPGAALVEPESDASHHDWRMGLPPRPRPPFPLHGVSRPFDAGEQRFAAPDGRVAPPPPSASLAGAQPDPRMERFQELRRQRFAHGQGERDEADPTPVADAMRQWWNDMRPNLNSALAYQREARASGMHPIPAYEPAPVSRLGDAFGRLAASARELSGRAQQAAAPTIKRIHDQVEQAAQGLISRFEGDDVRQQAPLLGPGRVAVFFRQGVTVGQAQRLLAASSARPMRLIPRKHGFLARVMPGKESEVCERLRQHPYVRDVAYLEYNEYGEPVGGRR